MRHQSFVDYISRKGFAVHSFYQLTQLVTWCLYQLFGANRWAWHLVHISLHALNCTLFYTLCRGILKDSGIERAAGPAFAAALLYCTTPYVSEVIVWEAAFHYLQGLLLILLILHLVRRFLLWGRSRDAWMATVLFGLSLFSLELFLLTPFFCGTLILYYRLALQWDAGCIRRSALAIVLPQCAMVAAYFIAVRAVLGTGTGRLGNTLLHLPITYYAVKPPDYFFHLLLGRFLPQAVRSTVHSVFCTYTGAGIFYLMMAGVTAYILFRFRQMERRAQAASLFFIWMLAAVALVTPLWFPEELLIVGDRYLYGLLPPFFMMLVLLCSGVVRRIALLRDVLAAVLLLQAALTLELSFTWQRADTLTDTLQQSLPHAPGKTTILLNNPASFRGAPMIGAGPDGEARLMHNLLYALPIREQIYDALAMNLANLSDSIKLRVLSSREFQVVLLQPDASWQYGPDVAKSYETADYIITVDNVHCYYTLRLKGDPQQYQLYYQHAGIWKSVDIAATGIWQQ